MGQQPSSSPSTSTSSNHDSSPPSAATTTRRKTLFSTFIRNNHRSPTTISSRSSGATSDSNATLNGAANTAGITTRDQQHPPRRKSFFQRMIKRNDDSDDSESEEVDERVYSLPIEFIQYRRGWYERHEDYAQQFDQPQSALMSHEVRLINSDIIPIIISFMNVRDCCTFSITCKLAYHYWLGDPWLWFQMTPRRMALHIHKYQPFSLEFINAKNWRDLAMIFVFNKTWRSIDSTFQVCKKNSSTIPKEESFFYFKNSDDELIVKELLFGKEGQSLNVKCKKNNVKYLVNFGESIDNFKTDGSKTQCIMFINLFTSNSSREMLCLDKFTKHNNRHDFLIVVYYWPKTSDKDKDYDFNSQLNNWRNHSELNFTPYLEYLEPIKSEKDATSFFELVLKWKAFKQYLKQVDHSPQDNYRGTIENMVLSYSFDYMFM